MKIEDLLSHALNKHCEPIVHEIFDDKKWEFIKFCCSHLNEPFMKHGYTKLANVYSQRQYETRNVSTIERYKKGYSNRGFL